MDKGRKHNLSAALACEKLSVMFLSSNPNIAEAIAKKKDDVLNFNFRSMVAASVQIACLIFPKSWLNQ